MKKWTIKFSKSKINLEKKCIFWNMLFSIMSSLQTAVIVLIVTRVSGEEDAGIMSIAFATAYLMFTIGAYGVRNFQATDSQRDYSYKDYRKMRLISCFLMVISSLGYCFWKGYEKNKAHIILIVCLFKLLDAIEDLYHGELQRIGRLDLAGFSGVIRLILNDLTFFVVLCLTKNLYEAICSMVLISFIATIGMYIFFNTFLNREEKKEDEKRKIGLIIACFPLFLTSFLNIYICNSPKYAIDICLSEKEQAYYAILSMPVFTIHLLSGIFYRPQLLYIAKLWNEKKRDLFKKMVLKQICNIISIAILIVAFGCAVGLRILELLYDVSLISFQKEFTILLLGGGMTAVYNFLTVCITIMRKQFFLIVLSVFIAILAFLISNPMVYHAGLLGASWLYFLLMLGEMAVVFMLFYLFLNKEENGIKIVKRERKKK